MNKNRLVRGLLLACSGVALLGICEAFAQPKEILIGHVAGYTGLEQMKNYDLGGYEISYSPSDHQGSKFVDLSVITGKGSLIY